MKKIYFFLLSFALLTVSSNLSFAQCDQCDALNPDFTLELHVSVDPPTTGPAGFGTTQAHLNIYFVNNTASTLMLRTMEISMALNPAAMPSLVNLTTDAADPSSFPNMTIFDFMNSNFVTIIDNMESLPNNILGQPYTHHYEYDHQVASPVTYPPVAIPANMSVHIATTTLFFDGSQTFVDNNAGHPTYLGDPAFLRGYSGQCVLPALNINNTFGLVDGTTQVLSNCYNVITVPAGTSNLPVELTEFYGEAFDRYNELSWTTTTEINTAWHVLQRSLDPVEFPFEEIGRVPAAGNSEITLNYSHNDNEPPPLAYYRLKTIDLDGSFQLSDVITLKRDEGFEILSLYPNPTTDKFEVQYSVDNDGDVEISLIDVLGRILSTEVERDLRGITKREFDISNLPDGVYIIQITNGVETRTKEVVKSTF